MNPYLEGYARARTDGLRRELGSRQIVETIPGRRGVRFRVGHGLVVLGSHLMGSPGQAETPVRPAA